MSDAECDARIEMLFAQVKDLPEERQRRFLDDTCVNDSPEFRANLEKLLDADRRQRMESTATDFWPNTEDRGASIELGGVRRSSDYPDILIPGYRFERVLGRGGMGIVLKCTQVDSGHTVAIKLLLRGRGARFEDLVRFRIEAEALTYLDHRSIVRIHAIGVTGGVPYFASEFAVNGDLAHYLKVQPKCDTWIVQTMRDLALGIHHAHERRILHRDIKPTNILVCEDGTPKVADFGLVKFTVPHKWIQQASFSSSFHPVGGIGDELARLTIEAQRDYADISAGDEHELTRMMLDACKRRTGISNMSITQTSILDFAKTASGSEYDDTEFECEVPLTQFGAVLGTPHFMAPEQAAGRLDRLDRWTDVYSLGATLYFCLTGKTIFTGSVAEILEKHERAAPPLVRDVRGELSEGVEAVINKCLQKDPERRYRDCEQLADDLDRCVQGRPPWTLVRARLRQSRNGKPADPDLFKKAFPPT